MTTDAGPASFDLDGDGFSWPGPATDWSIWDIPGGFDTSGTISCGGASSDVHWTVAWYALPEPPVSFTGTVAPGAEGSLGFNAFDDGTYVVDVNVSGGTATVFQGGTSEVVSSAGHVEFDTITGFNEVDVDNNGATPLQYTVRVTEKPVAVTLQDIPARYATPGASRTYEYNLSEPATVNAWVTSPTGTTIRNLIKDGHLLAGDHSLTWDGRTATGVQLPDGQYSINFAARNGAGSTATQTLSAGIDGTGPTITFGKNTGARTSTYSFIASDPVSGMRDLQLTLDGKDVYDGLFPTFRRVLTVAAPGPHTIHAKAIDTIGNTTERDYQVTGGPAPPPACNNAINYVGAVLSAKHFTQAVGRLAHADPNQVLQHFTIHKALCTDLTGDGATDLALMLKGRGHLRSDTPIAVYKGVPNKFTYVYGDSHASYRSMSLSGHDVVLRPSHGKSRLLHWNGKHFALRRAR